MKKIIDFMFEKGIVTNDIQASHVIVGLKLYELETDEEKKSRVILYRKWRPKTDKKNQVPWALYKHLTAMHKAGLIWYLTNGVIEPAGKVAEL